MLITKKQIIRIIFISLITIAILGSACQSTQSSPPPQRDFTTYSLLISPNSLPEGWEIETIYYDESPNDLGFRNNLGGSTIDLRSSTSSAEHIVARFNSTQAAGQAYADHDFTGNTQGKYAATNEPLANFSYRSSIAEQFRLTCMTIKDIKKIGESCAIEAQYEEFLSVLLYTTTSSEIALNELDTLAKAIDSQMSKFLEEEIKPIPLGTPTQIKVQGNMVTPILVETVQTSPLSHIPAQIALPIVTMSPQEAKNALLDLFRTNGDCTGKCLAGIRPDEMTDQEAVDKLAHFNLISA